jgi:hypothetical protein
VLYHYAVEYGYAVWDLFFEHDVESVYRFLKLFTALTGLGFLLAMRLLFLELGLGTIPRIVLLSFTGLAASAWFHFSAFETHGMALPAIALYLVALHRLLRQKSWTWTNRLLLIGALVLCGWTRIDLWRFALLSIPLLALPALRGHRRQFAILLALALLIGAAGNLWMSHRYLDVPLARTPSHMVARWGRADFKAYLMRAENLTPERLTRVGRAVGIYSILMPVKRPDEVRYFYEPLTTHASHPLSLLSLVGVIVLLLRALIRSVLRLIRGDPFHVNIVLQWTAAWLMYTWFNPYEPFLWILEFLPLQIAVIADTCRDETRRFWIVVAVLAALVGLHNWVFFYLVFR